MIRADRCHVRGVLLDSVLREQLDLEALGRNVYVFPSFDFKCDKRFEQVTDSIPASDSIRRWIRCGFSTERTAQKLEQPFPETIWSPGKQAAGF